MREYLAEISKNPLFNGIDDIDEMFDWVKPFTKEYKRGDFVCLQGEPINNVGIVLKGSMKIQKSDLQGDEYIINEIPKGMMFAEVFACLNLKSSPVTIIASEDSTVLFFDFKRIMEGNSKYNQVLTANMLKIVARKTLFLNSKMDILTKKTIREKIMAYLRNESKGAREFTISLNRQEMANYLCVNRSALSFELSKLAKEGIITYNKAKFKLL